MTDKVLWSKKCPKCGHSALEHKYGKPGESSERVLINIATGKRSDGGIRYCHHPVPAGVKDYYGFCLCEIASEEYVRAGNYAMIRLSTKQSLNKKI